MSRVLLVNMPLSNLGWPSLGLGLLKAALMRRNIPCDVAHFNFNFAELLGLEHYHWLADQFAFVLGGERLFAKHYFPEILPADSDYYREVLLAADSAMTEADYAAFLDTARYIEPFLESCMAAIDWSRYAVVGFTTTFQQTMPSLCLARRIKQLRPDIKIVFGGASCEGCVGMELLRRFPEIDTVFSGEADLTFPETVERWFNEGHKKRARQRYLASPVILNVAKNPVSPEKHEIFRCAQNGPIFRKCLSRPQKIERAEEREEKYIESEPGQLDRLDELPYPDFDSYFTRLRQSPLHAEINPLLFFETSRGCWWGQKHHCVFCGLNGSRRTFRAKSPARAIDELRHLVDRYGIHRFCAADNILDLRYFESLLPMLKISGLDLTFSYEMKTNLTRRQVEMLREVGLVSAQLGIETFSTPLLKRIGKGATAMQNLQTLRWLSETGMDVKWNLLYGFPGEEPEEYAKMAALLPSLYHLAPPLGIGRVRVNRFAPYFDHPDRHGIVNVRPHRALRYIYPFPPEVLERLGYNFDFDYADGHDPLEYARPMLEAAAIWQQLAGTVMLRSLDRSDGVLLLTDTRPGAEEFQRRMTGIERAIYLFCDAGRTPGKIVEYLAKEFGGSPPDELAIVRMLDQWVAARLMAQLDGRYLSLATQALSSHQP